MSSGSRLFWQRPASRCLSRRLGCVVRFSPARSSVNAPRRAGRRERRTGVFPRRVRRPGAVLLHERVGEDEKLPHHGRQGEESGHWKGRSFIQGGRHRVRRLLYMPALVAVQHLAELQQVRDALRKDRVATTNRGKHLRTPVGRRLTKQRLAGGAALTGAPGDGIRGLWCRCCEATPSRSPPRGR